MSFVFWDFHFKQLFIRFVFSSVVFQRKYHFVHTNFICVKVGRCTVKAQRMKKILPVNRFSFENWFYRHPPTYTFWCCCCYGFHKVIMNDNYHQHCNHHCSVIMIINPMRILQFSCFSLLFWKSLEFANVEEKKKRKKKQSNNIQLLLHSLDVISSLPLFVVLLLMVIFAYKLTTSRSPFISLIHFLVFCVTLNSFVFIIGCFCL